MRKLNVMLSMAMVSAACLSLYGCIIVDSPMKGWIYTETKYGDFATTHDVATKEGKACGQSILGWVASGDASVAAAKAAGVSPTSRPSITPPSRSLGLSVIGARS